jgi:hypothetical protein
MTDPANDSAAKHPLPPLPEGVAPLADVQTYDEELRKELDEMAVRAREYIESFSWCAKVEQQYFAGGTGFIFAIYLFDIVPTRPNVPSRQWVFVGDVPLAYLPVEDAETPLEAFDQYIAGMRRWIEVALVSGSVEGRDDLPPVNVDAAPKWGRELKGRMDFLEEFLRESFERAETL